MKKHILLLTATLLLIPVTYAQVDASISPSNPDDVILNASNSYEVSRNYSGDGSQGIDITYAWNNVDSTESDSGVIGTFTFDRDSSRSNTIRLTVSNASETSTDELSGDTAQVVRDVPNASITASSTNVDEGDTVDFQSTVTNAFDDPISYTWTVDGSTESTQDSFSYDFSNAGDYTVELTVEDNTGLSSKESVSVSVSSTDDGDDGSSGGSGSSSPGLGAEPDDEEENETEEGEEGGRRGPPQFVLEHLQRVSEATPAEPAVLDMTDEIRRDTGVRRIGLNVSEEAKNISVELEKAEQAPEDPGAPVEKILEIKTNVADKVDKATVEFDVSREWINNQSANPEEVVLKRLNQTWEDLPTKVLNKTNTTVTYKGRTPGFSYFAVGQAETEDNEEMTEESTQEVPQDVQEAIQEAENTISQGEDGYETLMQARSALDNGDYDRAERLANQAVETNQSGGWLTWIVAILVLLIVAVAIGVYIQTYYVDDEEEEEQNENKL